MSDTLIHYGILGMKWGVRRYQNEDGTWTEAGKRRYGDDGKPSGEKNESAKSNHTRKALAGAAAGAAVVTGAVLTAYLVKRYGGKDISEMASTVHSGKEALDNFLENSAVSAVKTSQIPAPKVEPKKIVEQAVKTASSVSSTVTQAPRPHINPARDVFQPYSFETLMKQNQDLLEKLYAELM